MKRASRPRAGWRRASSPDEPQTWAPAPPAGGLRHWLWHRFTARCWWFYGWGKADATAFLQHNISHATGSWTPAPGTYRVTDPVVLGDVTRAVHEKPEPEQTP